MIWFILPWVMSAITLTSMYLAGNKNVAAWWLGLFNQGLWFAFIMHTQAWGLFPTLIGLTFIYSRNIGKWLNEEKA